MIDKSQFLEAINKYLILVGQWVISSGLRIILILLLLLVVLKATNWFSKKLFRKIKPDDLENAKRAQTLETIVGVVWKTIAIALGIMLILGELGINLGPITLPSN